METIFFIAIILVLVCVVIGLLLFVKKKHKDYDEMMEEYQMKATASIAEIENNFKKEKESEVENVKESYELKISDYKEYIHSVEKFSRSSSDIHTHKILTDLKKKLVSNGKIDSLQMLMMANVFIPYKTADGELQSTKIDHLIVMKTGIYLINTKNWKGKILYGISKEKAREFPFLHENLYYSEDKETEKTIIYSNSESHPSELKVRSVDEPTKQVMIGYKTINELLEEHYGTIHMTPILYINNNTDLINYSSNVVPLVFDQIEPLYEFFVKEIDGRADLYSVSEIEEIKNLIENVHITT
ncbi:nuclease-related domain-containing protein [Pseudalkalibacillus sp. R45]|uniref:nuclease-related domain-containing protein n=1 Tax=Pseudalkalibacillus sp. R45 TaxID=3457433 RepID=UPI003FCD7A6D